MNDPDQTGWSHQVEFSDLKDPLFFWNASLAASVSTEIASGLNNAGSRERVLDALV